jgi:hypothetical protein
MANEEQSGGYQVDTTDLESTAGYIADVADFYDERTGYIGRAPKLYTGGLLPDGNIAGGNALSEAFLEEHRFVYRVFEESADGIRTAGRMISEAGIDYDSTEAEVAAAFDEQYAEVDSGNYESDQAAPTDHQNFEVTGTPDERRGAAMTEHYMEQLSEG